MMPSLISKNTFGILLSNCKFYRMYPNSNILWGEYLLFKKTIDNIHSVYWKLFTKFLKTRILRFQTKMILMKKKQFGLYLLIGLLSLTFSSNTDSNNIIYWTPDYRLTWDDFQGEPRFEYKSISVGVLLNAGYCTTGFYCANAFLSTIVTQST